MNRVVASYGKSRLATGTAEVEQALEMLTALAAPTPARAHRGTVGLDKGYHTRGCVRGVRALGFTPHVAKEARHNAIDERTMRHAGYAESQRRRKLVEEGYGWGKGIGLLHKLRHRGSALVDWIFTFSMAAYNLVRLRTLLPLLRVGVAT